MSSESGKCVEMNSKRALVRLYSTSLIVLFADAH